MAATIKIKNSSTASAVPTSSDLVQGELAVNVTDKRIFTENASGTVVELGTNPTILTLPDGSASAPTLTNDGDTNTGIFFPAADTVGITTGGTERARVDSSGNLGLGVTPSTWSVWSSIVQGNPYALTGYNNGGGNVQAALWCNSYRNSGGTNTFYASGYATQYLQANGSHSWNVSTASGTAGNAITFTQAMTLDASGNFMVGGTGYTAAKITSVQQSDTAGTLSFGLGAGGGVSQGLRLTTGNALAFDRYNGGWYESARIDSSGNLLVGTTTSSARLSTVTTGNAVAGFFKNDASGYQTVTMQNAGGSGTRYLAWFIAGTTDVGSINSNGTTTTYSTSSDYRLKNITGPVTGYKERLNALQPKQGSWKVDGSEFRGFLAHEFADSYPASVNGEKDAVDENGNPKYQGMQASSAEVIADLVAYIKELETRLSALEQA